MVIAYAGAGGKTTLLKRHAAAFRALGKKVFVTTSTHMYIEPDTLLTDDPEVILQKLEETGYAMAGLPEGEKIRGLSLETYFAVCEKADVVLVEADGSRGLPIKFPGPNEPVIYDNVGKIILVCGLHALGKPVREAAHRLDWVLSCLEVSEETFVRPEDLVKLLRQGYVLPLRGKFPHMTLEVCPSHDGSEEQIALANRITEQCLA